MVSLDVRKAFDSVSHSSVLVDYVSADLASASIVIEVVKHYTRPIDIRRGVKQGGPLSPVLFNMVLDELLDLIDASSDGGTIKEGFVCPVMVFADDIILLQDREERAQPLLARISFFLASKGMVLNGAKSSCVSCVVRNKQLISRSKAFLKIGS